MSYKAGVLKDRFNFSIFIPEFKNPGFKSFTFKGFELFKIETTTCDPENG